ncbi:polysaccharide deacetylase family protein [Thermodesulfovibrio hydrogeniphilus]
MLNNSIPVIMYHHVMPKERELNVTPEIFEEQISALKREGWKTLSAVEFIYLMMHPKEKRKKCVLLTFDDGFYDNYLFAYPILKKYKMKAVMFVVTDMVLDDFKRESFSVVEHKKMWHMIFNEDRRDFLCTWNELKEMQEEGIFDIESHGSSHKIPEYLKAGNYEMIKEDIKRSKETLKRKINKESLHLCWPKGAYDEKSINIACGCGFKALYTTERGANIYDLLHIKRLPVKCKGAGWLLPKLKIYSSSVLSKIYLKIRIG